MPKIFYNSKSGDFNVVYSVLNDSTYDIATTTVTIGTTDSSSTEVVVVETGSTDELIKLGASLYDDGSWIAILYRTLDLNVMKFHGFHVSGQ